jgi:hypothetical protein
MLSILAENSMEGSLNASSLVSAVTEKSEKLPVTLVIMRCFTLKWISEWFGSSVHLTFAIDDVILSVDEILDIET